jgi:ankyrin repeat protein
MGRLKFAVFAMLFCAGAGTVDHAMAAKATQVRVADANNLIIKRNYQAAFNQTFNSAKSGNVAAQVKLAQFYRLGLGVAKDEFAAISWLKKASAGGSSTATLLLNRMSFPTPPTDKKMAGGDSQNSDVVNFTQLKPRAAGQADWLTLAVARKNLNAVDALLATPNTSSPGNSNLAVATATKNNEIEILQKLLAANIAPQADAKNRSPLVIAVSANNNDIANLLLKNTSSVDDSVLHVATEKCMPAMISKLLAANPKSTATINLVSIAQNCNNWPDFKNQLAASDFNARDDLGRTAAWFAAAHGDTEFLAWLAKSGTDFSIADRNGLTPLHIAAVSNQAFSVRFILSIFDNAAIATPHGTTPLMLAAFAGCTACMKPLLEKSTDTDLKNNDGDTSLMFAVRGFQPSAAELLVQKGANPDARNSAGDTPAKLAERLQFLMLKGSSE